jgi:1-aminocyclopropane-1-carboxylate deaminase/D-cysteine desulfhydrase-like pyridoxal-dependent ACC family enzyme
MIGQRPDVAHKHALRALDLIRFWPIETLGKWPTPIQSLEHPAIGELYVKRDDLAGFGRCGMSGVKARKLEGFLGHLRGHGYQEVIMPLANMTNLGHDLAPLLKAIGVKLRILVVDNPPLDPLARRTLFDDMPDDVEFLGKSSAWALVRTAIETVRSKATGRRTLVVLPSPSHPSAVIGAARGFLEMVQQLEAKKVQMPSSLYITAAAGTTAAGFSLAESLLRHAGYPGVRILIVPVVPQRLEYWVPFLLSWAQRTLRIPAGLFSFNFRFLRDERFTNYARFDKPLELTCERVAKQFGLTLDPIYGAKSWCAMEEASQRDRKTPRTPIMFWHCGYSPDWPLFRSEKASPITNKRP